MRPLLSLCAAMLVAAAPSLHAQAPEDEGARLERAKAMREKAEQACQGKTGTDRRTCMVQQMCAQTKDAKACEDRAAKMKDNAKAARKACEGKSGAEHQDCVIKEVCSRAKDPGNCETREKNRLAYRQRIGEACKGKTGEDMRACVKANSGENASQK